MDKEEIKKYIDEKIKDSKDFNLLTLPFISQYRVLGWYGTANGAFLIPSFNVQDLIGKKIIIKSFQIINYALTAVFVDMEMFDGATTSTETIPQFARLDRLFDSYRNGTTVNFRINGTTLSMFGYFDSGLGYLVAYPGDLNLQNIYYKHPEKIQTIDLQVTTEVFENVGTNSVSPPLIKVVVECYLI